VLKPPVKYTNGIVTGTIVIPSSNEAQRRSTLLASTTLSSLLSTSAFDSLFFGNSKTLTE
jgi:hypothetical protein